MKILSLVCLAILVAGCARSDPAPTPPPTPDAHTGHSHDDHAHDGHAHGAPMKSPGTAVIDGTTFEITILGAAKPGGTVGVEAQVVSGAVPSALRLWIGDEAAVGSVKVKADGHDDHFHSDVEAPATLSETSALWLEIQEAGGERKATSVALPR